MKFSKMCAIAVLATAGTALTVSANNVNFARGVDSGTDGGEFIGTYTGDINGSRMSFCLELGELLSLSGSENYDYAVAFGGFGAVNGGLADPEDGPVTNDPLSAATAWAFLQWGSSLAKTEANAALVQRTIWYLEEEATYAGAELAAIQAFLALAPTGYDITPGGDDFDDHAGDFPGIRVVNPFRMENGVLVQFQSQIIQLIPLPAASGMALAGLALVGGIRRRK